MRKRNKKKEGNKRAKAQRKVGKASPALKKMGLCPKKNKFERILVEQLRTGATDAKKFPFPGSLGTILACSNVPT